MPIVTVAGEGISDVEIGRALVSHCGHEPGKLYPAGGKPNLDRRLTSFNQAARRSPWLVLRDLDHADCAPSLVSTLLARPASGMRLRIVVRAAESWLIADARGLASFLQIAESIVPTRPDELQSPKAAMVSLARRSRSRAVREDMVPERGLTVSVGPAYTSRIIEFVSRRWNPDRAARRSDSLARCIAVLERL